MILCSQSLDLFDQKYSAASSIVICKMFSSHNSSLHDLSDSILICWFDA